MDPVLVLPEGRVGEVRPRATVGHVGRLGSRPQRGVVARHDRLALARRVLQRHEGGDELAGAIAGRHLLRAATVVGEEHDERVVEPARPLELVEHPPDSLVHPVDLGGIGRHPGRLPLAVDDLFPRGHPLVARGQGPRRIDDPLLDQPLEPLLAELVPTGVEAAGVASRCPRRARAAASAARCRTGTGRTGRPRAARGARQGTRQRCRRWRRCRTTPAARPRARCWSPAARACVGGRTSRPPRACRRSGRSRGAWATPGWACPCRPRGATCPRGTSRSPRRGTPRRPSRIPR